MKPLKSFVLLLLCMFVQGAMAQLRLPAVFGDGMVMQRNMPVPVWGWATPGETVKVTLDKKAKSVKVAKDGTWKVSMPAMQPGGPYTLKVTAAKGNDAKTIALYVGDVFLFSGQSNQELPIRRCMDNNTIAAMARTYTNKDVHILKIPQQFNFTSPQDDCHGADWVTISPETAGNIAALSYLVGKELQEAAGVPVGIINSSVGGTRVEAWMSRDNLLQFPEYEKILAHKKFHQVNWADSIRKVENAAGAAWDKQLAEQDTVLNRWNTPGYDFSSWQPVNIFDDFYDRQQPNGSYWFRNTFSLAGAELKAADGKATALLRLGAMKDADEVFVNGKRVGNTTYQYPPRKYEFPVSLLREGENEVIIHLTSQGGTPNFTPQKFYQLEYSDRAILLDKGWTMAVGKLMPRRPSGTYFVDTPVGLYNAMIHPLGPLSIRAMVWYQGEANVGRPYHYKEYLQAMIDEWHMQFPTACLDKKKAAEQNPWPSVIVQLAGYMDRHQGTYNSGWCDVRDQQYDATERDPYARRRTPDCYLATAIDCGEWNDIHPQAKDVISHRIALQLRRNVYGEDIVSEGPRPVRCVKDGDNLVVTFSETTGKLRPFNDGIAKTTGDYELTVNIAAAQKAKSSIYTVVDNADKSATLFRYAHDDYPQCTIYNTDHLPSPQFSIQVNAN